MGLDLVEIIMATEETFKFAIADSEAEKCDTVGKLVELVHAKISQFSDGPCQSQHGFYVIRKQLMEQLNLSRSAIKPDTRLDDIIPVSRRNEIWQQLIFSITARNYVPSLDHPAWMELTIFLISVGTFIALFIWSNIILAFVLSGLAFLTLATFTNGYKVQFPANYSRVRDLVVLVPILDNAFWTKETIFEKIREITVEISGVKAEDVKMESKWVADLGID